MTFLSVHSVAMLEVEALSLLNDPEQPNNTTPDEIASAPGGVANMEGVYEYLPCHVMTAEERARNRKPKRKIDTKPAATSSKSHLKPPPTYINAAAGIATQPLGTAASAAAVAQTSLQAAVMEAHLSSVDYSTQLAVEQDDPILMEANPEVWNIGEDKDNDHKKDSGSVYSLESNMPSSDDDSL